MTKLPPITGIAEIVLNVTDLARMRTFYQQALRFQFHSQQSMETEKPNPQGEPTICFLQISESNSPLSVNGHPQLLALIDYKRHVFAKRFTGLRSDESSLNHLAFEIPEAGFTDYLEHLTSLGIDAFVTQFPAMNAQAIFFSDPEGNRLELIAHQPKLED